MVELHISGMNCQHCVASVRTALEAVEGVDAVVAVDLDSGRAIIEADVEPASLIRAVVGAGFEAALV